MRRIWFFGVTFLSFCFWGCSDDLPKRADPRYRIVTSIFPMQNLVVRLVPDVEVEYIVPYGANPHTFEPTPSTIRKLKIADLFIGIHPAFDGWLARHLDPRTRIHYLLADSVMNPHFWLSVRATRARIPFLVEWLSQNDPKHVKKIAKAGERLIRSLDSLDQAIRLLLEPLKERRFIQWHSAWDWFASDYGLEPIGTLERGHGEEPSLKHFGALIAKARNEKVRVIVVDPFGQNRTVETLAREIQGVVVRLDPIGSPAVPERSDYFKLMHWNARCLSHALSLP